MHRYLYNGNGFDVVLGYSSRAPSDWINNIVLLLYSVNIRLSVIIVVKNGNVDVVYNNSCRDTADSFAANSKRIAHCANLISSARIQTPRKLSKNALKYDRNALKTYLFFTTLTRWKNVQTFCFTFYLITKINFTHILIYLILTWIILK